jgi:NAD(P)-dependent dehydrogenase (short-subunit alcohol dehydrogenase family)
VSADVKEKSVMSAQLQFDGRVAIVTGAAGGMGACYSTMLAARGAKVVVVDKRPKGGSEYETVEQIRAAGGEAIGVEGDICDVTSVARVIASAVDAYGRLDILINNAGTSDQTADVTFMPDERLEKQLDIHLRGPMRMIAAAWPQLVASGQGRIINVGSSSAFGVCSGGGDQAVDGGAGIWEAAYSTAKCAAFALTRQAAGAGGPHGIKANLVIPWAWTPMTRSGLEGSPFGDWMSKYMRPELVGALGLYLVHADCPSNGQFYSAAGGRLTRIVFGAMPGYFNPQLTPEDVAANWGDVVGHADANGRFDDIFDIQGVESECAEIQRVVGPIG